MSSADLIRRELSFGDQDPITGWLRQVYIESTIKGSIQPKGSGAMRMLPVGSYSQYDHTLFTEYVVKEGDQIVDQNLEVYELNTEPKFPF
jgi:hypothetical protein